MAFYLRTTLYVGASGITLTTTKVAFYIPHKDPKKVYVFNPQPEDLNKIIKTNIDNSAATFGIYLKNLTTGQEYKLNSEDTFTAASLYKLAVMYTLYQKASEGKLDIDQPDIKNNLNSMITISSNEAAIYLVEKYTSWKEVTDIMHSIGLKSTDLNRSPPVTSPEDMGKLLEMVSKGTAINLEASTKMLELMAGQKINDRIPANLPSEAIVAHKTGELWDVRHDVGVVVTPENNYVLVLMSKDSKNPEAVKPVMAKISSQIYDFFKTQWANPPEIL